MILLIDDHSTDRTNAWRIERPEPLQTFSLFSFLSFRRWHRQQRLRLLPFLGGSFLFSVLPFFSFGYCQAASSRSKQRPSAGTSVHVHASVLSHAFARLMPPAQLRDECLFAKVVRPYWPIRVMRFIAP